MKTTDIYTRTMARMYARQGYFDQAVRVLEHLLEQEPDREDLLQGLEEIRRLKAQSDQPAPHKTAALLKQWTRLMLRYRRFRRLKKMQQRLAEKE